MRPPRSAPLCSRYVQSAVAPSAPRVARLMRHRAFSPPPRDAVSDAVTFYTQTVREHYLRDDVFCGTELAAEEHRGARERPPPRSAARVAAHTVRSAPDARAPARGGPGPDPSQFKLSATADTYLVVDTNVALHQARNRRPSGCGCPSRDLIVRRVRNASHRRWICWSMPACATSSCCRRCSKR